MGTLRDKNDWMIYYSNNAEIFRLLKQREYDSRIKDARKGIYHMSIDDLYPIENEFIPKPNPLYTLCMQVANYDYIVAQNLMENEDIIDVYRYNMHKLSLQYN